MLTNQSAEQEPAATVLDPHQTAELREKAESGDARAQMTLGDAYRQNNGVPQDAELALKWLHKSADQSYSETENQLGVMYLTGEGVARNKVEAVGWYRKAAKHGSAAAMFNLGACYYNGDGVDIDDLVSYAWFLLAREGGNSSAEQAVKRTESQRKIIARDAFIKVGELYEKGEVPNNTGEALKWYRKAAAAGKATAEVKVASLLLASGRKPTEQEYAEVQRRCSDAAKSFEWRDVYCMAVIFKQGSVFQKTRLKVSNGSSARRNWETQEPRLNWEWRIGKVRTPRRT